MAQEDTKTEPETYAVEYAGTVNFCRAEGPGEAITFVRHQMYDGYVHEEDLEAHGPVTEDEANKIGQRIRELHE